MKTFLKDVYQKTFLFYRKESGSTADTTVQRKPRNLFNSDSREKKILKQRSRCATWNHYKIRILSFPYIHNHIHTIHSFISICRGLSSFSSLLVAEPGFELEPAIQQASALPTEPHCTLRTEPRLQTNWATLHPDWATRHPNWATLRLDWAPLHPIWATLHPNWAPLHPIWATLPPNWDTLHPNYNTLHPI